MSGAAPYYTQALSPLPGRCFRLVASQGEAGPTHCSEPVAWRGSWRAPKRALLPGRGLRRAPPRPRRLAIAGCRSAPRALRS
jgi:hypothetical protein